MGLHSYEHIPCVVTASRKDATGLFANLTPYKKAMFHQSIMLFINPYSERRLLYEDSSVAAAAFLALLPRSFCSGVGLTGR